jgi:polysaccharide export outer membrane protein
MLVFSCDTQKSIMFQKGLDLDSLNRTERKNLHSNFEIALKKNDILLITLVSANEEFLKMFELGTENNTLLPNNYSSGAPVLRGYLINSEGKIKVPFIGEVTAEKRKINELRIEITEKLKQFITDPIVNIKLVNFKVTVLGEVRDPGTFNIPNEKISIIELIGVSKGVSATADLRNAKLIREEGGKINEYNLDLSKSDIVFSDKYFLQQNDILYIPPNHAKSLNANYSPIYVSLFTSLLSAIITTINFILK